MSSSSSLFSLHHNNVSRHEKYIVEEFLKKKPYIKWASSNLSSMSNPQATLYVCKVIKVMAYTSFSAVHSVGCLLPATATTISSLENWRKKKLRKLSGFSNIMQPVQGCKVSLLMKIEKNASNNNIIPKWWSIEACFDSSSTSMFLIFKLVALEESCLFHLLCLCSLQSHVNYWYEITG